MLGNSEGEEDTVKSLKVARSAHTLCLKPLMFVGCNITEFLSSS